MALLARPNRQVLFVCHRCFSTTKPRAVSLQINRNNREAVADTVPAYPYGPARWYKQSRLGLYGGQRIQFGNNVGETFKNKTRRSWHPNVQTRKLFSRALNRTVQVRVTTKTLRTIDKLGGLDEYLLGEKEARIKELGESGWWLRWAIMQTPAIKRRFREERAKLGIPEEGVDEQVAEIEESVDVMEQTAIAQAVHAEAESETEAMATSALDGAETMVSEPLATDDAFIVEQSPDLPPLKFRVGPGQHIVLTADGWRRTRPSPQRRIDQAKSKIEAKLKENVLKEREEELMSLVAQESASLLSQEEQEYLVKSVRRGWTAEVKQLTEQQHQLKMEKKASRLQQRKQSRKEAAKKAQSEAATQGEEDAGARLAVAA